MTLICQICSGPTCEWHQKQVAEFERSCGIVIEEARGTYPNKISEF